MQSSTPYSHEFTGVNNIDLSMKINLISKDNTEEEQNVIPNGDHKTNNREIAKFWANHQFIDEAIQYANSLKPEDAQVIFTGLKDMLSKAFKMSSTKETSAGLIDKFKKAKMMYTDYEFPGTLRSLVGLYSKQQVLELGNAVDWDNLIWLRPGDIHKKGGTKLFSVDLGLPEIKQGVLGNNYFMACLYALGNMQNRIKDLFLIKEINDQGLYSVKFYDFGTWKPITVDDYIPCDPYDKNSFSYRAKNNEIWIQILEKGWAKLNGSYLNIEIGSTKEFLRALTGAPVKSYRTENHHGLEAIWKDLLEAEKNGFAALCGGGDSLENANLIDSAGLMGSLPYIIQRAFEMKEKKEVFRIVKLNNPWGQGDWNGWDEINFNQDIKARVLSEPCEQNSFFMPYQEFVKYFTNINICRVIDANVHASVQCSSRFNHATYFKLSVSKPGIYNFTVSQKTLIRRSLKEHQLYNNIVLLIARYVNSSTIEYISGTQGTERDVWTSAELSQGEYLIYVKIPWRNELSNDFVLSTYGPGNPTLTKVSKHNYPDIMTKIFISKGRISQNKDDYEYFNVQNCFRAVEFTDDGFSFIYYQNKSNKVLEEELYFKIFEGLKLRKPYRGRLVKITVNPGEEKIVIAKQLPYSIKIRQAFTEKVRFV